MRTEEEVRDYFAHEQEMVTSHADWLKEALKSAEEDKRFFGEADYGEVEAARSELRQAKLKAHLLSWVLGSKAQDAAALAEAEHKKAATAKQEEGKDLPF